MFSKSDMKYFGGSMWVTVIGLMLAATLGFMAGGIPMAIQMLVITAILSVLEVSLSFDNAVVNAKVLKTMDPVWQHRFITWGMVIAVFGMRVIFPLLIVAIAAKLGPIDAVTLALTNPAEYERILTASHISVAFFGGAFLLLVGLEFFFDADKDEHWVHHLEVLLNKIGGIKFAEAIVATVVILGVATFLPAEHFRDAIVAGFGGLITFALVKSLDLLFDSNGVATKSGAAAFLYLEVLDASFSFDGVIGAFALTNNMLIIAIGLGIGAMFVRSLTLLMVDKGTVDAYKYMEHGAFYAILALAACMFGGTLMHIPEWFTGLIGAGFITLGVLTSPKGEEKDEEAELVANAQDAEHLEPTEQDFRNAQQYLAILSGLTENRPSVVELAQYRESFKRLNELDISFEPETVAKLSGTA
jgi:hypothetical protein